MANPALAKADLRALRQEIARIEEGRVNPASFSDAHEDRKGARTPRFALGIDAFDGPLLGGLPLCGMSEVRSALTVDAGAASGFALALAVRLSETSDRAILWIGEGLTAREAGRPHAAGLHAFGLDPDRLVYAMTRKLEDALWVAEAALAVDAFAAVVLEVRGNVRSFGLTESRRLHLKARNAGLPLLLLRQAGEEEAGAAPVRFRVEAGPAAGRLLPDGSRLAGTIGHPVFHVTVEKSRNPGPFALFLEWNPDERQFYLARPDRIADDPAQRPAHSGDRLSASFERSDRASEMGRLVAFRRAS